MMINKMAKMYILERIRDINKFYNLADEEFIINGFSDGRGHYIKFGNTYFARDRNIVNNRIYITGKNYQSLRFLLNRYEKYVKNNKYEFNYSLDKVMQQFEGIFG
jgi:hypothetical protein